MDERQRKMAEFINLLEKHAPQDGIFTTAINNFYAARSSQPDQYNPVIYEPGIIIAAQGEKQAHIGGKQYNYRPGNFLVVLLHIPAEVEVVQASPEKPLLAAGIYIDLNRFANLLLKMDMVEPASVRPESINASGVFSAPVNDSLLDAVIRLLKALDNPVEAAILGEGIIDEIYFRILNEEQGGMLKYLLQQRGQIRQISRAVEYIHQNLDKPVSVEDLATIVNMSSSNFRKRFKEVLHVSPLQYTKSIKLDKARSLILTGNSVTEAGYSVGYNSPAQFSREYKRHFGHSPSVSGV